METPTDKELKSYSSHIDQVIKFYRELSELDFNAYKELIRSFLISRGVRSGIDLKIFKATATNLDDAKYYKISGDSISVRSNAEEEYKLIEIDKESIRKQTFKLKYSSTASAEKIFRGIGSVNAVHRNEQSEGNNLAAPLWITPYEDTELLDALSVNELTYFMPLLILNAGDGIRNSNFLSKSNETIFKHLASSILNAEYLIMDDYFTKLSEIETIFSRNRKEKNDEEEYIAANGKLYTENAVLRVCWFLQEACFCIRKNLQENGKSNLLLVNSDRKKRLKWKDPIKLWYQGKNNTLVYERFLESVIDMTLIDHNFRSSPENVEKLFRLYYQLQNWPFSDQIVEIRKMLMSKVSIMLELILNDNHHHRNTEKDINVDYYQVINSQKSKAEFIAELESHGQSDLTGNSYLEWKRAFKNEDGTEKYRELNFDFPLDDSRYKDLKLYHEAVRTGCEAYLKQSDIIGRIKKTNDQDENEAKDLLQNIIDFMDCRSDENETLPDVRFKNLSPSFYRQTLLFLSNRIRKEISDPEIAIHLEQTGRYIATLNRVLYSLSLNLDWYESDVPLSFRPCFESSFYEYKDGKIIFAGPITAESIQSDHHSDFKNKFFFASIDCKPVNSMYLRKLFAKYSNLNSGFKQSFEIQGHKASQKVLKLHYENMSARMENKISDLDKYAKYVNANMDFKFEEISKKSDNISTNLAEKLEELEEKSTQMNEHMIQQNQDNLNTVSGEISKNLEKKMKRISSALTQKSFEFTVCSLGAFAAFIAFVTMSVDMTKVAKNIQQYVFFTGTFMFCLLVFVVYLKHGGGRKEDVPEEDANKTKQDANEAGQVANKPDSGKKNWFKEFRKELRTTVWGQLVMISIISVSFIFLLSFITKHDFFNSEDIFNKQDSINRENSASGQKMEKSLEQVQKEMLDLKYEIERLRKPTQDVVPGKRPAR